MSPSDPGGNPTQRAESAPNSAPPLNTLLTLRALARAIGVDAGQLSKESSRPGFPGHATDQGVLYSPDEVIRWRQANVRRKKSPAVPPRPAMPAAAPSKVDRPSPPASMPPGAPEPGPASPAAAVVDPPPLVVGGLRSKLEMAEARRARDQARGELSADEDAELLQIMRSPDATPLEISRATVRITARRVARAHYLDTLGPNDLDGLKKALQEARQAEADYIKLEESRRQLIPRDEVREIATELALRLVRVCESLENKLAAEFSLWLADAAVLAMTADERSRTVRAFVNKTMSAARIQEAEEIERLISEPRGDQ